MIKLDVQELDDTNLAALRVLAEVVENELTHHDRSRKAKETWKKIDRQRDPWWEIKTLLINSGDGIASCHYCERSMAGEIEHIFPKNHYPELAFEFENYVFSCRDCNRLKSDKWAVYDVAGQQEVHLKRAPRNSVASAPPVGEGLFLNLRKDDPLEFLHLDVGTGKVVPIPSEVIGPINSLKAKYTINLLDLNSEMPRKSGSQKEKDALARARRGSAEDLLCWANDYDTKKRANSNDPRLEFLKTRLLERPFRMVWYQLVKQTNLPNPTSELLVELKKILDRNPELATLRP